LSDNTSQWSMAPSVRERIATIAQDENVHLSRYPEIYGHELKAALANRYSNDIAGLTSNNFVVGCGTDDVLDCIIRACTAEGDVIVNPRPSFPMAGYFGRYNDREILPLDTNKAGEPQLTGEVLKAKLIYLCTPNNPTGISLSRTFIEDLLAKFDGFVVIDEAYAEFNDDNFLPTLENNERVIVLRTFSKLHALAGLRIGYAIASREVISAIEAVRGPYKANTIALAAAIESLSQRAFQNDVVEQTREVRTWFIEQLRSIGLEPLKSDANFVFIPMEIPDGLREALKKADIAIRIFDEIDVYGSGIRVTIAPQKILEKLLAVLKDIV
jgi:histidinol-phosphate aminotransferase